MDPRIYQITILSTLLAWGTLRLGFDVSAARIATILATALATQWLLTRTFRLPRFDPRSPLISGLSLCLLLRTDLPQLAALAAVISIASKFLIRRGDKHVFNPTAFGLALTTLLFERAWISGGQWGSTAFFAFLIAGLGGLVVHRAERSDITWAFLASWAALLFGRALWLGDPWQIPFHQCQSGAVLLFAFLMISDPRTTPDSRIGRILLAVMVTLGAGWIQFVQYGNNGPLLALVACSLFVPVLDRLLPGTRFTWDSRRRRSVTAGDTHPPQISPTGEFARGVTT